MDLTTLIALLSFVIGWNLATWLWKRSRRSRPRPIEELRASIQERRESLRRAAATDYEGRRSKGDR